MALGLTGAASTSSAAGAKTRCKGVTRALHGKKKQLRICHGLKTTPRLSPTTKPPSPPAPPRVGTKTNPVPVGANVRIDESWRLTLLAADPNQTDAIVAFQRGDPDNLTLPPLPGFQYLLARVSLTRTDTEPATFSPYSLDLTTVDGRIYDDAGPACGTYMDPLEADGVAQGQTAVGNVCWKIATADLQKLLMLYTDPFTGATTYFSLGL